MSLHLYRNAGGILIAVIIKQDRFSQSLDWNQRCYCYDITKVFLMNVEKIYILKNIRTCMLKKKWMRLKSTNFFAYWIALYKCNGDYY